MPETSDRKDDHIRIIEEEDVETTGAGFADIDLVHEALPEIHRDEIDTTTTLFGQELAAPIVIESMTGGHPNTTKINRALAEAAQETNIAMGVGSQRAGIELEDEALLESYTVVRDVAPDAFLYGNVGAAQLLEYDVDDVEQAVEMIDADAMAIHLNFLQEPSSRKVISTRVAVSRRLNTLQPTSRCRYSSRRRVTASRGKQPSDSLTLVSTQLTSLARVGRRGPESSPTERPPSVQTDRKQSANCFARGASQPLSARLKRRPLTRQSSRAVAFAPG